MSSDEIERELEARLEKHGRSGFREVPSAEAFAAPSRAGLVEPQPADPPLARRVVSGPETSDLSEWYQSQLPPSGVDEQLFAEVRRLVLQPILDLHHATTWARSLDICDECEQSWPCATARAAGATT